MRTRSKSRINNVFQTLPTEIMLLIFTWIHPNTVLQYKSLCTRINLILNDTRFATSSLSHWIPTPNPPLTQSRKRTTFDTIWLKWPPYFQSVYVSRKFTRLTHFVWREDRILCDKNVPKCITMLSTLTHLILPRNNMTGPIPHQIYTLLPLLVLDLSSNRLTGSLSPLINQLPNLTTLNLEKNNLEGCIPHEIGSLTNLTKLALEYNELSGHIPTSLSQCTALESLQLGSNSLTGQIPREICMSLINLSFMSLGDNNLSGEIPSDIIRLKNLEVLYLQENQFSGKVPRGLKELDRLVLVRVLEGNLDLEKVMPDGIEAGTRVYEMLKRDGFLS
jgi:Leucine-rich repeat (LRR) protein